MEPNAEKPTSPIVRIVEAVVVAGLTALVTGVVNLWLERKKKKDEPKKDEPAK